MAQKRQIAWNANKHYPSRFLYDGGTGFYGLAVSLFPSGRRSPGPDNRGRRGIGDDAWRGKIQGSAARVPVRLVKSNPSVVKYIVRRLVKFLVSLQASTFRHQSNIVEARWLVHLLTPISG